MNKHFPNLSFVLAAALVAAPLCAVEAGASGKKDAADPKEAHAVAPTIEVVSVAVSKPLSEDVDGDLKTQRHVMPGLTVTFMVSGENLVGIGGVGHGGGVYLPSVLSPDGKNTAEDAWSIGRMLGQASSAQVTSSGKHMLFDVHVDTDKAVPLDKMDAYTVEGTMEVLMSSGAKEVTRERLKIGDKFEVEGLTVTLSSKDLVWVTGSHAALDAVAGEITLAPAGGKPETSSSCVTMYTGGGGGHAYRFGEKHRFILNLSAVRGSKLEHAGKKVQLPADLAPAAPVAVDPNAEFTVTIPIWQNLRRETLKVRYGKAK